jgi:hypothetical protein
MRRSSSYLSLIFAIALLASACAPQAEERVGESTGELEPARPPADTSAPALTAPDRAADSILVLERLAAARTQRLDTLAMGALVAALGRTFVGTPYVPQTLDPPGPERLVVNLRALDCVTFVENVLALARTVRARGGFAEFVRELERIRYRTGTLAGYPSRLHYFSEWIAANEEKGLVREVTRALGGVRDPEPIGFMSAHRSAYWQLADDSVLAEIRALEERLAARPRWYVPEERIEAVSGRIEEGDIIAATSTLPGLDVAHTGIAVREGGRLHLMHAPLVGDSVEISAQPLAQRILRIERQDGIMVARPR